MTDRAIRPDEVRCKDGTTFGVGDRMNGKPGAVFLDHRDPKVSEAGLLPYDVFHEPGDRCSEYRGMPVAVVRTYCRLHGSVAEIGPRAKSALQELSDREAQALADMPSPPPDDPSDEQQEEGGVVVPFARPRRLPAPRYPVGHSISSSHPWPRPRPAPTDR